MRVPERKGTTPGLCDLEGRGSCRRRPCRQLGGHIGARGIPEVRLGDVEQGVDAGRDLDEAGVRGLERRRGLSDVKRLRRHRFLLGLADRAAHQRRLGAKRRLRGHQLRNMSVQHAHGDWFPFALLEFRSLTAL